MKNLPAALYDIARKQGALDHVSLHRAAPELCRATVVGEVLAVRAGGVAITDETRNELLLKCRAGEHVEIEIDIHSYEQKAGETNRNFVRFRDGAMVSLGRTGKGTPFLRDHNQHDSLSVGGFITASATEKRDEGSYAIKQTATLTATWLVELALRGLLRAVSIGWIPTGPVLCSACNAPVFSKCWHWRGERLAEVDDEGGGKRKVRKADGDIVVEFIYTAAELCETSSVPIGAVPGAHIEEIRAALALDINRDDESQNRDEMKTILTVLATILSLPPTAGEEEVTDAVKGLAKDRDTLKTKLEIVEGEKVALAAEVDKYKSTERQNEEDTFVRDALSSGRITLADESVWRKLFALDAADAKLEMAKRKPGTATPVGQKRQSEAKVLELEKPQTSTSVDEKLTAGGVDPSVARGVAKALGVKDFDKTVGGALGLGEGA